MVLKDIKEQKSTLKKLQNLLNDETKKVHGVYYTNDYFSQRYLARSQMIVDKIDIKDNDVKLKITMRLESAGLKEIELTLYDLVHYNAGDVPGFSPEGIFEEENPETFDQPYIPERISLDTSLFSTDVLLILKDPEVTFQEFTIAGTKFTIVNLRKKLIDKDDPEDNGFNQHVSILFGEADKLYFFSHFFNKDLTTRDAKLILDLIIDENITGRAVKAVRISTPSGATSSIFPSGGLISSYETTAGEYIFGNVSGYVRIMKHKLNEYKMQCTPQGERGGYRIDLIGKKDTIQIFME